MTLSSLMTLKLDLLCRMFTFKTSLNPLLSEKYPAAGSHLEKVFQKVSDLKKILDAMRCTKITVYPCEKPIFPKLAMSHLDSGKISSTSHWISNSFGFQL